MRELKDVQKVLLSLEKRAENKPDAIISETFVDAEPLIDIVSAPVSQIIFGRRGTGKTHILKYCLSDVRDNNGLAVYLDIRSIGSNGSYYADTGVPSPQRGLRLVSDILQALLDELYDYALQKIETALDPNQITIRLDDFSKAIGEVKLSGEVTQVIETARGDAGTAGAELSLDATGPRAKVGSTVEGNSSQRTTETRQGRELRHLDFSRTQVALRGLLEILNVDRMWLFLDEWSETPQEIQPYLADLVRKTILPTGKIIVKIAAIEQRSSFAINLGGGNYIGLELGADIGSDLSLDDFLVFDYDESRSKDFFRELIYKNFLALGGSSTDISSSTELSNVLFTEKRAVEEFIRAVEGVPRDAINLTAKIVTQSFGRKAGVDDVRRAALDWYTQDKVNLIASDPNLHTALNHIIDEVIGNRRARAFLFPSNVRHRVIDSLFDARLLHLLKKNISSRDEPGRRYDAWKIDYGCYVDLIRTQKAPLGLLPADENEGFVEVPTDDYRSIRRAVLMPDQLEELIS